MILKESSQDNKKNTQKNVSNKFQTEKIILDTQQKEEWDRHSDFYLSPVREFSQTQIELSPEKRKQSSLTRIELDNDSSRTFMESPNPKKQASLHQKYMRSKLQNLFQLEGENSDLFKVKRSNSIEKEILTSSSEQKQIPKNKKPFISDKVLNKKNIKQTDLQVQDCNCSKSKCLKLYCKCFQNGQMCGEQCSCTSCYNNENFEEIRQKAIKELTDINPFAFKPKYKKLNKKDIQLHTRGCTCSKSGCVKNYCECYAGGVGCSNICQCKDCQNIKNQINDEEKSVIKEKGRRKKKKSMISELFTNDSQKNDIDITFN